MATSCTSASASSARLRRLACAAVLFAAGCAFNVHHLSGPLPQRPAAPQPIHASAGVQFMPEPEGAVCGTTFQQFVTALQDQRVFEVVTIAHPTSQPDVLVQAQFACRVDRHDRRNNVVAFFEGFGALVPALLALHDIDVGVEALVVASRGGRHVGRYTVDSRLDANAGYFGIVGHEDRVQEMVRQADEEAIQRLIVQLYADRSVLEALPAGS